MTTGIDAIQSFLTRHMPRDRLIIKNKEIHLIDKSQVSFWSCLKAKFGRGNVSMKKVAEFVHINRNSLFPQDDRATSIQNRRVFNDFIKDYNRNKFSWKTARKIGKTEVESITFFGKEDWGKIGIKVKDAPPLPSDIKQIYRSPCPVWPGKTVGETHMLVLIPKMLGDKPITMNRLRKLACEYFLNKTFYYNWEKIFKEEDGSEDINQSYWILMTKEVLPDSSDYDGYCIIPKNYKSPKLVEASICILTQYLKGKKFTDKSSFCFHDTLTLCNETNKRGEIPIVGKCDEKGFYVHYISERKISPEFAVVRRL